MQNYRISSALFGTPGELIVAGEVPAVASYYEETGVIVYDKTLAANGSVSDDPVIIDTSYDFILLGLFGSWTNDCQARLKMPNGRYVQTSYQNIQAFMSPNASFPLPFAVPFYLKGGSRMSLDVKTVAAVTVQINFIGIKRFPQG